MIKKMLKIFGCLLVIVIVFRIFFPYKSHDTQGQSQQPDVSTTTQQPAHTQKAKAAIQQVLNGTPKASTEKITGE